MTIQSMLVLGAAFVASAEDIKLEWQPSGVAKSASYRYSHLTLSADKPDRIKAIPAGLTAPLFGTLPFGPVESPTPFYIIIDEPAGKPSRLFVDANANGDLTDDPPAEWLPQLVKNANGATFTNYAGGADLQMAYGDEKVKAHLGLRRIDKHAARTAADASILLYYRDYARVGDVALGGKTYHALLSDEFATGDFRPAKGETNTSVVLLLDLNHDGVFERHGELFDVSKPFNIGGTTYEVASMSASGGAFQFVKSSQSVPETLPRPNLEKGHDALAFEAKTTDGDTIHFPQSYKGKLVLVDFWATWCAPCRRELPHVTAAYHKYHDKGFEVLGVSLDRANASETLANFTRNNHMPWPEIYDGQFWKAAVAQTYYIDSIPHPFLVDGDTGKILAEGMDARGEKLSAAIEKALAQHP